MTNKIDVNLEIISNLINSSIQIVVSYAGQVLGATIILIIGFYLAGKLSKLIRKKLGVFDKIDPLIVPIIGNIIRYGIIIITLIAVLGQFGVQTTSIIAVLGAAGLAVGLALQGSLSNFASGVLIILLRPFKSGDYVEAGGKAGTVKKIEIFSTELRTPDNKVIIMPNSKIMSDSIINYSRESTRRIDLVIGVGYDADLRKAKEVLKSVLDQESRILKDPAYNVSVSELADSSVNFIVRPWVNSGDYWPTYWSLIENIKIALDDADITIPFPQMDVHLHKQD